MSERQMALAKENLPARQEVALPLEAILRAAQDPDTDVSKMETLVSLYERMQDRSAQQAFNGAMVACQADMPRIKRDGQIVFSGKTISRYAKLETVDAAIRPVYEGHGFAVSFNSEVRDGKVIVSAEVQHSGGHKKPFSLPMTIDGAPAMSAAQKVASTIAYARRILQKMIWNLIEEGEDKDGQEKTDPCISQEQADTINTLLTDQRRDRAKFFEWATEQAGHEVGKLTEIPARLYSAVMQALRPKGAR